MSRTLLALGLLAALSPAPAQAASPAVLPASTDRWVRAETGHFTLFSDAGVAKTREVATELERFRAVLALLTTSGESPEPVPTSVVLFRNEAAMAPYRPRFDVPSRNPVGFFQPSRDGNMIALAAGWNSDPRRVVIHEYLHDFLHGHFAPRPLWYHEGAAEFYGTFRSTSTEAQIGLPLPEHLALLRRSKLLPLSDLFSVAHDSAEYHDPLRQRLFYAESWALVHYLLRGAPQRTPQLGRFLELLQQGRSLDAAFAEAFHTDYETLLTELVRYVHGHRFPYARASFAELPVQAEPRVSPIGRAEVLYRLGDLLVHAGDDRGAEAEAHFQAALAQEPGHAGALAGLGLARMNADRLEEADGLFREAIAAGTRDFRVHYHFGMLRMSAFAGRPFMPGHLEPAQRRRIDEARAAFRRSIELNGNFAEARAALGRTFLAEDAEAASEGVPFLEAAVGRLPSRNDLALDLALLYERVGDRRRSDSLLKAARGERARTLQRQIERERERQDSLARVNDLLGQGREDEAIADLEQLASAAPPEVRAILEAQLKEVRRSAAYRRSIRDYNEAVACANRKDLPGALALFRTVAACSEDAELARSAEERAGEIQRSLARRTSKKG